MQKIISKVHVKVLEIFKFFNYFSRFLIPLEKLKNELKRKIHPILLNDKFVPTYFHIFKNLRISYTVQSKK
jgi:hypothetical protein